MTAKSILSKLSKTGGCIVPSDACSTLEIAQARACDRFAVIDSFGFVLRPSEQPKATEEPDILAEYRGTDGHRDWWSGGAWLYPGDSVAIIRAAAQPVATPAQGEENGEQV